MSDAPNTSKCNCCLVKWLSLAAAIIFGFLGIVSVLVVLKMLPDTGFLHDAAAWIAVSADYPWVPAIIYFIVAGLAGYWFFKCFKSSE